MDPSSSGGQKGAHTDELRRSYELEIVGGIFVEPHVLSPVSEIVGPPDFTDPRNATIFSAQLCVSENGREPNIAEVSEYLNDQGLIEAAGDFPYLAEAADWAVNGAGALPAARRLRRFALRRQARHVADELSRSTVEPTELRAALDELAVIDASLRTDESQRLEELAFSGERFMQLLERPTPDPVLSGIPPEGHLMLVVAAAFTGKSSWAYWYALSRAAGIHPWPGAPAPPQGRTLIYSIDEAVEQVARRMNGLSMFHPAGMFRQSQADRIHVLGADVSVDPNALDRLRFDPEGLNQLGATLADAERRNQQFKEIFVDAYADTLPPDDDENSSATATRIAGHLERMSVRYGVSIVLLHHAGKPQQKDGSDELPDVRFLGRGSSALAAKARTVAVIEHVSGMPHLRRFRTITNLGASPRPALFSVCPPESDTEELLFWRPHDPLAGYKLEDLLGSDETISSTELAWRIIGSEPKKQGDRPPSEARTLAAQLRDSWLRDGVVLVAAGPRKAKLISRT